MEALSFFRRKEGGSYDILERSSARFDKKLREKTIDQSMKKGVKLSLESMRTSILPEL